MSGEAVKPVPVLLPELDWVPAGAWGDRRGARVTRIVVHRWGVSYRDQPHEAASYRGVVRYFQDAANKANAHIVYPGSAVAHGREATQMVPWDSYAWTEADYNPTSDELEIADAIWLGLDWHGFHVAARMVAMRLHARGLPAIWSTERGFCRHADLGAAGGGHTSCPTTDIHLWRLFANTVANERTRGGFRKEWGR